MAFERYEFGFIGNVCPRLAGGLAVNPWWVKITLSFKHFQRKIRQPIRCPGAPQIISQGQQLLLEII